MDVKTKRLFSIMLYLSLATGAVVLCFNTAPGFFGAMVAYFLFAALMIAYNIFFLKDKLHGWPNALCIASTLATALCVQFFDHTVFTGFPVMIVIIMVLLIFRARIGIPIAVAAAAASSALGLSAHGFPQQDFWSSASALLLPRLFLIAAVAIARYSITVSVKNRELAESLQRKTGELEIALAKLQSYTEELRETADLRARDQLMRDLHDKLGHVLATASISAQAAAVLMDRDIPGAKDRLATVSEQIQAAMKSLRDVLSGNTIEMSEQEPVFSELDRLAGETEQRTGIPIRLSCAAAEDFDAMTLAKRSFLYNALMEGLTNGIRHGQVTRFDLSLTKVNGQFRFSLRDNGKGFRNIQYGYGLSKIERDARRFGGILELFCSDGCELRITLPLESGQETEGSANG